MLAAQPAAGSCSGKQERNKQAPAANWQRRLCSLQVLTAMRPLIQNRRQVMASQATQRTWPQAKASHKVNKHTSVAAAAVIFCELSNC